MALTSSTGSEHARPSASTLIFSEEYSKFTKGMFVVWMNHAREASRHREVQVLLNHEHWAHAEARDASAGNDSLHVSRLTFELLSTRLKRALPLSEAWWPFRGLRYGLGRFLDLLSAPFVVLNLAAQLRGRGVDVVFSHNGGWPAGRLCRWIIASAWLARVPARVFVVHNYPTPSMWVTRPWRWFQARLIDATATDVVTVSDSVKAILQTTIFRLPVTRIHNGIQVSGEPESLSGEDRLSWRASGLTVGFIGSLFPLKGPHVLLDAFKLVDLRCELVMVGPCEPDYLRSLQHRADQCSNPVSFLGFQRDIATFLRRIDVLVVPSIAFESFGMVILEAMLHKTPVICTDFGGMKEVVLQGVTGLVVCAGDDKGLAEAISDLLSSPDRRRAMGEAGFERLRGKFTAARMEEDYHRLASARDGIALADAAN